MGGAGMKRFQVKYFIHAESIEAAMRAFQTCHGIIPEITEVAQLPAPQPAPEKMDKRKVN
jgi:hypothetical protein